MDQADLHLSHLQFAAALWPIFASLARAGVRCRYDRRCDSQVAQADLKRGLPSSFSGLA